MKYDLAKQKYEDTLECIRTLESKDIIDKTVDLQKRLSRAKKVQIELDRRAKWTFWEFGPEGKDIPLDDSDGEAWVSPEPSPSIEGKDSGTAVEIPPFVLESGNEKERERNPSAKTVTRMMSVYMVERATGAPMQDPVHMQVEMPVDAAQAMVNETKRTMGTKGKRKKDVQDTTQRSGPKGTKHRSPTQPANVPSDPPCDKCARSGKLCYAQMKSGKPLACCVQCRDSRTKCLRTGVTIKRETNPDVKVVLPPVRTKRKAAIDADERVLRILRSPSPPGELPNEEPRPSKRTRITSPDK